ncbi:type II toxin-antitoxin system VapC family toxin [Phytohabitans rumicis]|uniref:Ribonuclease VapC n=1 Tax=Phytohabitans rumicis TaxID=1076125 RepID=A0A6V8L418_9ACTN|nr:PIN domain-containing protein [Phytohabitans rumicis]GFJ88886.1 ribonuclease VapC [Phytohabitans rumicis]
MIVVDTGPLVAAINAKDAHHESCAALLRSHPGPLMVPAPVITEVFWLLESTQGPQAEAAFLDAVARSELDVVAITALDAYRMAELVRRYADLPLGAVDASVVTVAERLRVTEIATLDRRHFTVVRPAHVEAFTLLPEPT